MPNRGYTKQLKATVRYIRKRTNLRPKILIILGSGLGEAAQKIKEKAVLTFKDIPYFITPGTRTHEGKLIFGNFGTKPVMVMQGRCHVYEGYSASEVAYPVAVARELGAKILITTSLCGGINRRLGLGDFMVVKDHINLSLENPLIGFGPKQDERKFLDLQDAYSARLRILLERAGASLKIKLKTGVLAYLTGPNFETTAELRFLDKIGADAVGWSMLAEVLMARYLGMKVMAISCISDLAYPDKPRPIDFWRIFDTGLKKAGLLEKLLFKFISFLSPFAENHGCKPSG